MLRRLGKLLALSWSERMLLAEAATALIAAKAALALGGLRLGKAVGAANRVPPPRPMPAEDLDRIAVAVRRAATALRLTCLPQSLAVMWLLRRRGVRADLRFGAKLEERTLGAHAWVVVDDGAWTFDIAPTGGYVAFDEGRTR